VVNGGVKGVCRSATLQHGRGQGGARRSPRRCLEDSRRAAPSFQSDVGGAHGPVGAHLDDVAAACVGSGGACNDLPRERRRSSWQHWRTRQAPGRQLPTCARKLPRVSVLAPTTSLARVHAMRLCCFAHAVPAHLPSSCTRTRWYRGQTPMQRSPGWRRTLRCMRPSRTACWAPSPGQARKSVSGSDGGERDQAQRAGRGTALGVRGVRGRGRPRRGSPPARPAPTARLGELCAIPGDVGASNVKALHNLGGQGWSGWNAGTRGQLRECMSTADTPCKHAGTGCRQDGGWVGGAAKARHTRYWRRAGVAPLLSGEGQRHSVRG
jgi:hypothetical protein